MAPASITANYSSPTSTTIFSHSLPNLTADATKRCTQEKTTYLAELRAKTGLLQTDINTYLTQRVNEDKNAAASGQQVAQDEKAEEMYGEEDPEQS